MNIMDINNVSVGESTMSSPSPVSHASSLLSLSEPPWFGSPGSSSRSHASTTSIEEDVSQDDGMASPYHYPETGDLIELGSGAVE